MEVNQNTLFNIAKNDKENFYARKDAINNLTDPDVLNEIINGDEKKYKYEWYNDAYQGNDEYSIVSDLRETARERLAELKGGI